MKNFASLSELLNDPTFTLKTAENVFRFLVALGNAQGEKHKKVVTRAQQWLFTGIKDLPQIYSLAPMFVGFLAERYPLPRNGDPPVPTEVLTLLKTAEFGAGTWDREYMRFKQLEAVLLAYTHLLRPPNRARPAPSSN